MDIQEININKLVKAEYNPRKDLKPTDKEYQKIKKSIQEFGYVEPIIINKDYTIIGGHQRLKVLKDLGYKEVQVVILDIDKTKEKALNIALNKISGEWDLPLLKDLLQDIDTGEIDIELTGFDNDEIEDLLNQFNIDEEAKEDDFDVVEELENIEQQQETRVKRGDVWKLGNHRLICGDSTNDNDLKTLMQTEEADLLITDPPYNVNYEGKTKDKLKIQNDLKSDNDFSDFLEITFKNANNYMRKGAVFYIWHSDSEGYNFRSSCHKTGWKIRQCLIWNKNTIVMGRQDYHWKHEPCLYGWKEGTHYWNSDRKQSTVIEDLKKTDLKKLNKSDLIKYAEELLDTIQIRKTTVIECDKPSRSEQHPTMKPIKLFDYQIKNSTKINEIVLDIFGGSGTTIMACEQNKRNARVVEIDEKYCDVILARWEKFTGKEAIRIKGGGGTWQNYY